MMVNPLSTADNCEADIEDDNQSKQDIAKQGFDAGQVVILDGGNGHALRVVPSPPAGASAATSASLAPTPARRAKPLASRASAAFMRQRRDSQPAHAVCTARQAATALRAATRATAASSASTRQRLPRPTFAATALTVRAALGTPRSPRWC